MTQSKAIEAALKHAGKPHRLVVLHGADHQITDEKDRATLLGEVADSLRANLPSSADATLPP